MGEKATHLFVCLHSLQTSEVQITQYCDKQKLFENPSFIQNHIKRQKTSCFEMRFLSQKVFK